MIKRIALVLALVTAIACGGGGGDSGGGSGGGGTNKGVTMNVNSANLAFGQTLYLKGTITGASTGDYLEWSANGGKVDPLSSTEATYTAPSQAGTYTVTARSNSDPNKYGTVVISVSQVGISIAPQSVMVGPGTSTTFTATVTGSTNTGVIWSNSGGSFTSTNNNTAVWKAPTTNGTYTVTASSAANSNIKAVATITVGNVGSMANISGKVVLEGSTTGVSGVQVAFYNSAGTELSRLTTNSTGAFSGSIPNTAKRFSLVPGSLVAYYKIFGYGSFRYNALVTTCTAPLPALTSGSATMQNIRITPTFEAPPPPPNGCGP